MLYLFLRQNKVKQYICILYLSFTDYLFILDSTPHLFRFVSLRTSDSNTLPTIYTTTDKRHLCMYILLVYVHTKQNRQISIASHHIHNKLTLEFKFTA